MRSVPRIQVTQAGPATEKPETLLRYLAAVGVRGSIHGPTFDERRKPRYVLVISAWSEVQAARDALWPYLSTEKREQIDRAFTAYEENKALHLPRHAAKEVCKNGHDLLNPENLYWTRRSGKAGKEGKLERRCSVCAKARAKTRYDRLKQERKALKKAA